MIVNLTELRLKGEPLHVKASFTGDELFPKKAAIELKTPAQTELEVSLIGERVRVVGSVKTSLMITCCRCAQPIPVEISKRFDLEYWPDPDVSDGEEFELTYQDLDVGFYRDYVIDLSGVVSEQVVLEIPMKPVCRENCKGLCDQCGADLNKTQCQCSRQQIDPRLSALADIKNRLVN